MAPPPGKRRSAPDSIPSSGLPQVDMQASPQPRKTSAAGGPFIHGICGKTFTTRRSVKKHHWGAKVDDISTRTGCWAKHDKPNRAWDEHPSCKVDAPKSRVTKTARAKPNTSMAPGTTPASLHTEPGFPMFEGFLDEGAATTASYYHKHAVPYTSNLATSDDADSLLTVVNAVAKVDAPTPQCRNDSVAAYLDAQATAAEQDGGAGTLSEAPALVEKDGEDVVLPLSVGVPQTERKA